MKKIHKQIMPEDHKIINQLTKDVKQGTSIQFVIAHLFSECRVDVMEAIV